ncbi:MAG: hypothetical protein C0393_08605 [Anaerolinea sp.]|nr:hypothetical protein [Anaerolinea sp.]
MPRKVKLIFNPMADMSHAWRVANDLRPIVAEYGNADWSGTVYPTHATELARQAGEQGYDMVIAVGGDGTVHEVINGLMQAPAKKRPSWAWCRSVRATISPTLQASPSNQPPRCARR